MPPTSPTLPLPTLVQLRSLVLLPCNSVPLESHLNRAQSSRMIECACGSGDGGGRSNDSFACSDYQWDTLKVMGNHHHGAGLGHAPPTARFARDDYRDGARMVHSSAEEKKEKILDHLQRLPAEFFDNIQQVINQIIIVLAITRRPISIQQAALHDAVRCRAQCSVSTGRRAGASPPK